MAGVHNFDVYQGETWNRRVFYEYNGAAVDLSGFSGTMWLKRSEDDTEAALVLSSENGGVSINGALGRVTLTMAATVTAELSGTYLYDLKLSDGGGNVIYIVAGKVFVTRRRTP